MDTLVDSLGRRHDYLRISLTDRCNLRCRYCMPAGAPAPRPGAELLDDAEIVRLAALFTRLGVRKIRLTGGEPTVRPGLVALAHDLARLPGLRTLALTTNGLRLRELAAPLRAAGVSAVNISCDSLRRERFAAIAGRDALDDVIAGIDAALAARFAAVKVNAVVAAGINDDELDDFVAFARDRAVTVRFIEVMPFRDTGWGADRVVPGAVMLERIAARHALIPVVGAAPGAVATEYAVAGHAGRVGFITPLTAGFCADCTRLRLTAGGVLRTCLFGRVETALRAPLRAGATDDRLAALVLATLRAKEPGHGLNDGSPPSSRGMFEIGG